MTNINNYTDYLISTEEFYLLHEKKDIILIDTREPEDYSVEHIPGAINIYDIFTYLATEDNGGYEAMRHYFASIFGSAGISADKRVVIYEDAMDNGYGRSCRGYYILKHLGHKNVSVLHGGFQAWVKNNYPITNEIPVISPAQFVIEIDNSLIVDKNEVLSALNNPDIILLDVRDHAEWIGVSSSPYGPDFTPRKGRLPGAIWIEWYNMMKSVDSIPMFKSKEELRDLFKSAGITNNSNVIIYCFKGARTSNVYICMKMAEIENVRCYFAAWNEWSRIPELPIETGYPKKRKSQFK